MKKKISVVLGVLVAVLLLVGCTTGSAFAGGYQLFDTTFVFDKAVISMPDGSVVSGPVSTWKDYENSDQIQVVINGDTYLTHITNVVLIKEG